MKIANISLLCCLVMFVLTTIKKERRIDSIRHIETQALTELLTLQKAMLKEVTSRMIPDDMQYVTVSAYNAVKSQTDDTPHIAANGKHVKAGTCAISRDLIARGWAFGDLVYVPRLNATFEIADTMNIKHQKGIDILFYSGNTKADRARDFNKAREFGRLRDVQVFLLQKRGE